MWHSYLGVENLNLNPVQRTILVDALRQLGPASNPQPARLCHWRTRLDGEAAIFEALFNENNISVQAFKNRLGGIFGVDPSMIDHTVAQQSFAGGSTPVVTFSRNATDYLRVALFAGIGAGWNESGNECRGYLVLYRDEWEEVE